MIDAAQKYHCVILYKDIVAIATDGETIFEISGGNPGLTKGGTGDTLAGVVVGLASKNSPLLSAAAGAWLLKKQPMFCTKKWATTTTLTIWLLKYSKYGNL